MDELGFNKIAAAVLATGLGFMGLKEISHMAMHVSAPETPAYRIAVLTPTTDDTPIDLPFPQPEWIEAMDADQGAKVFKKCTSCHNADEGGANGTGPNLWNVVGQSAAQHSGFNYSSAMTNSGFVWDYETLDGFLEKPTRYLSGTAMNFVGLKKESDRAAVIEYLRLQSNTPVAQPEPAIVETGSEIVAEIDDLGETVEDMVEGGTEAVADIVEDGTETAGEVTDTIIETTGEVVDDARDATETVIDSLEDTVEDATDTVTESEEELSGSEEE